MEQQYLSKTGKQRLILLLVNILFFGGFLLCCATETKDDLGLGYSLYYLFCLFPIYGLIYGCVTYQKTKRIWYPNGILFMSGCVILAIGEIAIEPSSFTDALRAGIIVSAIVTILSLLSGIFAMLDTKAREKQRREMDGQTSAEDTDKPAEDTDKPAEDTDKSEKA